MNKEDASDHDLLIRINEQIEALARAVTARTITIDTRIERLDTRISTLEKAAWMLGGGVAMLGMLGFGIIMRLLGMSV